MLRILASSGLWLRSLRVRLSVLICQNVDALSKSQKGLVDQRAFDHSLACVLGCGGPFAACKVYHLELGPDDRLVSVLIDFGIPLDVEYQDGMRPRAELVSSRIGHDPPFVP